MNDSTIIFAPKGRLDASNAAVAERDVLDLLEKNGPSIVLDLTDIAYMSSAGLRVLLVAAKAARQKGGRAVLAGPHPAIMEVLRMSGFDKIMTIAADRDAALAVLRPA